MFAIGSEELSRRMEKKSFCLKDKKLKAFEWKSILKFLTPKR